MKRRSACVFLFAWLAPAVAGATTINVGPADSHTKIEAAKPGDEVVLAPGKYTHRVFLEQKATPQAPLIIRAQDPKNPPVVDLTGTLVENAPGSYNGGDKGRACWQLSGATNIEISGIVFTGCSTASHNAAGIRYYEGSSVHVKDCVFRKNDNGLTGGSEDSTAVVEFSEFDQNGNLQASAPTHNVYIYGGTFTLRSSYLHDPIQGQNFHVRAHDSTLEYNWFARAKSYTGDIMTNDDCSSSPCDHNMLFRGNVIIQGSPQNTGQIIALYNDNGVAGASFHIRMLWNTVVMSSANAHAVHLSNADGAVMTAEVSNNVFSGGGAPIEIEDTGKGTANGTNNWMGQGTQGMVGPLTGTVFGTGSPFKNAAAKDYTLAAGSTAINAASAAPAGAPDREYFQDETIARSYRVRASTKDIGAFESTTTGPGIDAYGAPPTATPDAGTGTSEDAGAFPTGPSLGGDGGQTARGPADPGANGGPGAAGPNGATATATTSGGGDEGCGCRTTGKGARAAHALWPGVALFIIVFAFARRRGTKSH